MQPQIHQRLIYLCTTDLKDSTKFRVVPMVWKCVQYLQVGFWVSLWSLWSFQGRWGFLLSLYNPVGKTWLVRLTSRRGLNSDPVISKGDLWSNWRDKMSNTFGLRGTKSANETIFTNLFTYLTSFKIFLPFYSLLHYDFYSIWQIMKHLFNFFCHRSLKKMGFALMFAIKIRQCIFRGSVVALEFSKKRSYKFLSRNCEMKAKTIANMQPAKRNN